jgi:hypothetical protein
MRNTIFAAAAAAAAVALLSAGARAEAPEWTGNYSYTEEGGRTTGGYGIVVTHEIAVTREGAQYQAEITANGYQTNTHVFALGTVAGNKLQLRFDHDGTEQLWKGRYKPGTLLLELERAGAKRVLTHWGAYTPATRARFRNPGVYFKRD